MLDEGASKVILHDLRGLRPRKRMCGRVKNRLSQVLQCWICLKTLYSQTLLRQ